MEEKTARLEDFEDLRNNVGFHFTPKQNVENILKTGLTPRFGANSTGALGQSAIPKTYISYGLEGVLQLYNRLLNLSLQGHLEDFQGNIHKPFIPESAREKESSYKFNILEGFEFVRQYMENNVYLMFDAPMSQYEHKLSEDELMQLNCEIRLLKDDDGENITEQISSLNEEIAKLSNDRTQDNSKKIEELAQKRNQLAIDVWKKTSETVQEKQGKQLNDNQSCVLSTIDFNDERLVWTNFEENPHNTHTRMFEKDGKVTGVTIPAEILRVFSVDNSQRANGIQFFNEIYSKVIDTDVTDIKNTACTDVNLLKSFSEYVKLVEQYKEKGLLIERPEQRIENGKKTNIYDSTLVVDLENISKYPGLQEFQVETQAFYDKGKEECKNLRKELKYKESEKLSKILAKVSAKDESIAIITDKAENEINSLEKQPEQQVAK